MTSGKARYAAGRREAAFRGRLFCLERPLCRWNRISAQARNHRILFPDFRTISSKGLDLRENVLEWEQRGGLPGSPFGFSAQESGWGRKKAPAGADRRRASGACLARGRNQAREPRRRQRAPPPARDTRETGSRRPVKPAAERMDRRGIERRVPMPNTQSRGTWTECSGPLSETTTSRPKKQQPMRHPHPEHDKT